MKLTGLSRQQAEESRKKRGSHTLTQIPPDPLWKKILEGFKDPMIMILLVALAVQVVPWLMHKDTWKFSAVGSGFQGGLEALCLNFGVNV